MHFSENKLKNKRLCFPKKPFNCTACNVAMYFFFLLEFSVFSGRKFNADFNLEIKLSWHTVLEGFKPKAT